MLTGTCHCGAVSIQIPRKPRRLTDCNCSICRRYGVLWAYYPLNQVRVRGDTTIYLRGVRRTEFHHCAVCRCLTHWSAVDKTRDRMGVNARLLPPEVLQRAKIVPLDGASI